MAQRISIVDYGMGNLRSVQKALAHVAPGDDVEITADPERSARADRVVFPGQGAMPDCMRCLDESGLGEAVAEAARDQALPGAVHRPADAVRAQRRGRHARAWACCAGRVVGFDVTPERRAAG